MEVNGRFMLAIMRTANNIGDVRTNVKLRSVRLTCCSCGKIISIAYSEFVFVVLAIQQAKHMGHIILSSVAIPALREFFTLSPTRHDFRRNFTERKMCILILSTNLSETFLILRRNQRDSVMNVHRYSCKVPVFVIIF